nr:hypothetical protein [Moraxella osloensis]
MPEGDYFGASGGVFGTSPKSNSSYQAINKAMDWLKMTNHLYRYICVMASPS